MKLESTFFIITIIILLLSSCSETTNPSKGAFITVNTFIDSSTVSYPGLKLSSNKILTPQNDLLHLKSVSLLITGLTFSNEFSDELLDNDSIKSGPLLFYFDSTGYSYISVSGRLPAGNYNNVKLELHQFSQDESNLYRNDPRFWVFTTDQRFSTVIEVTTFNNNDTLDFYYRSTATAEIALD